MNSETFHDWLKQMKELDAGQKRPLLTICSWPIRMPLACSNRLSAVALIAKAAIIAVGDGLAG